MKTYQVFLTALGALAGLGFVGYILFVALELVLGIVQVVPFWSVNVR